MVEKLWKTIWKVLKIVNTELPDDAAILLVDIYPRAKKTSKHKNLYMNAQIIIHNSQKMKTPSEWQNKIWSILITEYCSVIKKYWYCYDMTGPQKHFAEKEARWKTPYIIWFHLYKMSRMGKSIETECRLVTAYG